MHVTYSTILAGFIAIASAKKCLNQTITLNLSARQGVFNIVVPSNNLEVEDFVANVTQQGRNFSQIALTGYNTTVGKYNISTKFCTPDSSNTTTAVQVLTHGIGFDKTYWDLSYNNYNYSYVNSATDDYKYSTLSFDRLGTGNSTHGDPLNEVQIFLEVEILAALTRMLRNGSFPGVNSTFSKVVHVGHSFGSSQSYLLANMYPSLTDGIVLTGFSMNSSFTGVFLAGGNLQLASLNQPLRFGPVSGAVVANYLNPYITGLSDYLAPVDLTLLPPAQNLPAGYLVSSNAQANKLQFLKSEAFDPKILDLAERTKQPATPGEFLTLGALPMANRFTGPVLVITGDSDVPFCGGDCLATGGVGPSIPAAVQKNFANVNSSNFVAYIQPNTAHGINLHYNSTGAYKVIGNFLKARGL